MAGELVKWMGGNLIKRSSALQRCREAREAALTALRPQEQTMRARPVAEVVAASSRRCQVGLVVDLPRICAVHGGPYAARYIFANDGCFRLGSMIAVTETLYMRQYAGNENTVPVQDCELAEETCPLCGAAGRGSVRCHVCKNEVCYGCTSGRYFRCHCGGEGVMKPLARVQYGVTPVDMQWR